MSWALAVSKDAGRAGRQSLRALRTAGDEGRVLPNRSRAQLVDGVREAAAAGDPVLVVGGDGTLNLVVDALLSVERDTPPTLGIVSAGTGSDFARMFAVPNDIESAVEKAVHGEAYPTDAMELRGEWGVRYGVNVFEAGLGASTIAWSDRLPRWVGPIRYEVAFWLALPSFRPGSFVLEVEGRTFEGRGLVVVAANGEFFGGGMRIAPKASLMDGAFDMIVVDVRKREAFSLFPRMKQGLHLTHPGVRRVTTPWFRLTTDPGWPTEADGEFLGDTPVEGRILPGVVHVRV